MKKAFTLAEVLITLTIIGVIAALTIPNLMRKWEDHHTVSAVKEVYSILDNAFKMAIREEGGDITDWYFDNERNKSLQMGEKLKKYLKVNQFYEDPYGLESSKLRFDVSCGWKPMLGTGCTGTGFNTIRGPLLKLANGMDIFVAFSRPTGYTNTMMGNIYVDINGVKKGPNRAGYDFFSFTFNKNGMKEYNYSVGSIGLGETFPVNCSLGNNKATGQSCARWIMRHGNCEYKYKDVSSGQRWDSPWIY